LGPLASQLNPEGRSDIQHLQHLQYLQKELGKYLHRS